MANCRQTEGNQPSVKDTRNNHQSYQDLPNTVHSRRSLRRHVRRNAGTGPDSLDSSQNLEVQQWQFIDEDIETLVSTQRQPGFRKSWRFLSCSTLTRMSISLLRAQKAAFQCRRCRFDDTVIMQTGSSSPISTMNSENASESRPGNATGW